MPILLLGGVNTISLIPATPVLEVVQVVEVVEVLEPSLPLQEPKKVDCNMDDNPYCSCVRTARLLGLNLPPANAEDLKPNIPFPEVGDGVLLSYSTSEHIAVIFGIDERGIIIGEGNYKRGQYTERIIPWDYPHIRGFVRY